MTIAPSRQTTDNDLRRIVELLMPVPTVSDGFAMHKAVYGRLVPPGRTRDLIFTPVNVGGGSIVAVRGSFDGVSLPDGATRPLRLPEVGEEAGFTLRANPTVKYNGNHAQISLRSEKDALRLRWLERRAAENGFALLDVDFDASVLVVSRPTAPFALNVADYSGRLRVTDVTLFSRILACGLGRAAAWGCGMLMLSRPISA